MTIDNGKIDMLIDKYVNLQRIKFAKNRDEEIDYQLSVVKAKLEARGIVTEKLDMQY